MWKCSSLSVLSHMPEGMNKCWWKKYCKKKVLSFPVKLRFQNQWHPCFCHHFSPLQKIKRKKNLGFMQCWKRRFLMVTQHEEKAMLIYNLIPWCSVLCHCLQCVDFLSAFQLLPLRKWNIEWIYLIRQYQFNLYSLFFLEMVNTFRVLHLRLGFSFKGVTYAERAKLCLSQEFIF